MRGLEGTCHLLGRSERYFERCVCADVAEVGVMAEADPVHGHTLARELSPNFIGQSIGKVV